jgi:hypothetical protein
VRPEVDAKYAGENPADVICIRRIPERIVSRATIGRTVNMRRRCRPAITCPAAGPACMSAGSRKRLLKMPLPTQRMPPRM